MSFADIVAEWCESVEVKMDDMIQVLMIKVGERMVRISPIDTGHFRANWQLTTGEDVTEISGTDLTGSSTLSSISRRANGLRAGQVAYISNPVHYGYDLEYGTYRGPTEKVNEEGFSRQAPLGLVRTTQPELQHLFVESVNLVKG